MESGQAGEDENVAEILAFLQKEGIEYQRRDHAEAKTMDDLMPLMNDLYSAGDVVLKNLFFKDRKMNLFLCSVASDTVVDTKHLQRLLKISNSANLRLAAADLLLSELRTTQGHLSPLSVLLKTSSTPIVYALDIKARHPPTRPDGGPKRVWMHPGRNDVSVGLTVEALERLVQGFGARGVDVRWFDFAVGAGDGS
ncbi:YbaK/ProRS associated domain-containing protein [Gonapodya prolifera JEL478]|uniref:YbaK/ProRS associated domain-containing protein n=1 Tax=Gonapodya prolifera (strain JEL478) TaxID=1344416 RepID=A0A139AHK0_GONPJ|nr:YbaK/ProRS associated domain-containing protein [Gonapodya prolifera JEL478]|eukprot:KXS16301.1 YbaK/ProRS associated domain-containing protein [Gonapodya prolifera JEL478]